MRGFCCKNARIHMGTGAFFEEPCVFAGNMAGKSRNFMFRSDNLFSRFMNVLFDIILIDVLWIVCSLPLVTAGAAFTGAYYAMAKSVRYKTGYTAGEFFHSFRNNFKQSLPMSAVFWLASAALGIDIWYVWNNDSRQNSAIFMILVFILFLMMGVSVYVCPLLSRFEKRNLELIKLAALVMFKYLPVTVVILVLFLVMGVLIYLMPWAVLVLPGVYLYALTFPMEKILRKLMPDVEEGSEEAEKWYYQ
ncbi:MAG: YesL family protein [Lachnospiraceae bacterium]|nr:YesL family protein [Lachnospiraceae bacterium]